MRGQLVTTRVVAQTQLLTLLWILEVRVILA